MPLSNANIDASDAIQGPKHTDHDDLDNGDDDDEVMMTTHACKTKEEQGGASL